MEIEIQAKAEDMGRRAAARGADELRKALDEGGEATVIVATGASQFEMLKALVAEEGIAWQRVIVFHLDEYIGIPITHPASFRLYLWQRFASALPVPLKAFHYIDGEGDPDREVARLNERIRGQAVDVAFIGIGENGHIAFNDPPADFETEDPYIVVELDEACRRQQMGEGWFPDLDAVPKQAISMSVRQIMKSRTIVCTVPDRRKAEAVKHAVEGPVTPDVPASILQDHENCTLFLDTEAASGLKG